MLNNIAKKYSYELIRLISLIAFTYRIREIYILHNIGNISQK